MIPLLILIGVIVMVSIILIVWTMSNTQQRMGTAIAIVCLIMIVGFALLPIITRWAG